MNDKEYEQLQKDVNRINEEVVLDERFQVMAFRDTDDLIRAMRAGEVPGIEWTPECEAAYQVDKALEGSNFEWEGLE